MKKILFLMSAWLFSSQTYAANICAEYEQHCRFNGEDRALTIRDLNGNVETLSAILRRVVDSHTVYYLDLSYNQLQVLPVEFVNLRFLTMLNLSSNQLTGPIPDWSRSLRYLKWLDLSNNQLTGSIPDWIGNLVDLKRLDLSENGLQGTLPEGFRKLVNLTYLNLSSNQLPWHKIVMQGIICNMEGRGVQVNIENNITSNTGTGSRTKRVACTSELEATEATEAYLPCMDEPVRPDDAVQPHKEDSTVANPNADQAQAELETGYQALSLGLDISEDIELLEALGVEIAPCHE